MGVIISNGKLVKYMEEHGGKENTTIAFSKQQNGFLEQNSEASEQYGEEFIEQVTLLSSAVENILMAKSTGNSIVSELLNFKRYLKYFQFRWRRELTADLASILGPLPVIKKSDQRLSKAIDYTESFFQKYARRLINRIKNLIK